MKLQWNVIPTKEFDQHSKDWDELNIRTFNSVLLRSKFYKALLTTFGDGNEQLVFARLNDGIVACGIFVQSGRATWQTFQPAQAPLGAFIFDQAKVSIEQLASSLQRQLSKTCFVLGISQLDPVLCPRPNRTPNSSTLDYIETAHIPIEGSFTDYWTARGRNLRQNLKRQRNRLAKENISTRLELIFDAASIESCIADYGEMESRGWKAEGGTAIHLDNDQGQFYKKILEQYCESGNAVVCRYFYNEDLVASDLCLYDENMLIILKTTHDERQKSSSPAFLMRQDYFQRFFEDSISARIEFYGNLMQWHTKWSTEVRRMYHVNHYRWPFLAKIHKFRK